MGHTDTLTQISSSRFKQSKLSAHFTYLRYVRFSNCFGDFWVYLGINRSFQRISEIYGNRKFEDLMLYLN